MEIAIAIIVAVVLIADIFATSLVVRSPGATRRQKTMQTILVWSMPIFGAVLIGFFHADNLRHVGPDYQSPTTSIGDNDAINLEMSRTQDEHHGEH